MEVSSKAVHEKYNGELDVVGNTELIEVLQHQKEDVPLYIPGVCYGKMDFS